LKRIKLLPFQYDLAAQIGCTPEEYQWFLYEVQKRQGLTENTGPQAAFFVPFLTNLVIGVGLTLLGSLFKPKVAQPGRGGIVQQQQDGASSNRNTRVAPRYGFGSFQEAAKLNDTIPFIAANREELPALNGRPAGLYGGVRITTPVLWSQMWSLGGGQLYRGIFMLGEGEVVGLDPLGFALGDTALSGYALSIDPSRQTRGRYTVYFNQGGGPQARINSSHRFVGSSAANDIANLQNKGGDDVFTYYGIDNEIQNGFSYCAKPSTSTRFGLFGFCPNGMTWRRNPRPRPMLNTYVGADQRLQCDDDPASLNAMWEAKYRWSTRSGVIKINGNTTGDYGISRMGVRRVEVGDTFVYKLSSNSDANTEILMDMGNTDIDDNDGEFKQRMTGVAGSVASIQRSADDSLIIGELYKIGSAYAILVDRDRVNEDDPGFFLSDADNEPPGDGQSMEFRFEVVQPGRIGIVSSSVIDPSNTGDTIEPPRYDRDSDLSDLSSGDKYGTASNFFAVLMLRSRSTGRLA
jgi:hypothetical protein